MFKIIVLQTVYKLSIEQTELQIRDRLSFRDFLDLAFADTVPDAKTIGLFAEQLKKQGIEQQLFDRFNAELEERGFGVNSGLFVAREQSPVRKQREKSKVSERFTQHTKSASHKDTDATYTYKNDEKNYGYKNHVSIDDEYKFIRNYSVTTAKAHELSVYLDLVPDAPSYADQEILEDSAYWGEEYREKLTKRCFTSWVHERGCGQKKLTEDQRLMNKVKSGVRCRVEHVFGAMWIRCRNDMLQKMDGVELFFGSVCVTWRTIWSDW